MSISNPSRSIVLRQFPSYSQPVASPKEVSPTVIYTRSPPQQPINPTVATTLVRQPRVLVAPPIATQQKIIRIDDDDNLSYGSDYSDSVTDRRHRKLLSGFHPYYDKVSGEISKLFCRYTKYFFLKVHF